MPSVLTQPAATNASVRREDERLSISSPSLLTATLSLGLATTGTLFALPLSLASLGVTGYAALPLFKESYQSLVSLASSTPLASTPPASTDGNQPTSAPSITLANALVLTACIATGNTLAAALGVTLYHLGKRLVQQSEITYRQQQSKVVADWECATWRKSELAQSETQLPQLQAGNVIRLDPGETVPMQGVVTAGNALLTSPSPSPQSFQCAIAQRQPGDTVPRQSKVIQGALHLQLSHEGEVEVQRQQQSRRQQTDRVQQTVKRNTETLTDATLLPFLAVSALSVPVVGWAGALVLLNLHWGDTLRRRLPITDLRFLQQATAQGVQVQDVDALRRLGEVDAVLFDPTVLQPTACLGEIFTCDNHCQEEIVHYAAALGCYPEAPSALPSRPIAPLPIPDGFQQEAGGVSGWIDQRLIHVGNAQMMRQAGITLPADLDEVLTHYQNEQQQLLLVAAANCLIGAITLQPCPDPALPALVQQLQQRSVALYQLSDPSADRPEVFAQQIRPLPVGSARQWLQQQRQQDKVVAVIAGRAMPSALLQTADVVIATQAADTSVQEAAHLRLLAGGLTPLPPLFALAQQYKMRRHQDWGMTLSGNLLTTAGVYMGAIGLVGASLVNGIILCSASGSLLAPIVQAEIEKVQTHWQRTTLPQPFRLMQHQAPLYAVASRG